MIAVLFLGEMRPRGQTVNHSAIDWEALHEYIQQLLAPMRAEVEQRWPQVRSRPGKTFTEKMLLFSYCAFENPSQPEVDPVVVGVDFAPGPAEDVVRVRGDLCGEETGSVWFEVPEQQVSRTQEALRKAAESVTTQLAAEADRVAEGLALAGSPTR